MSFAVIVIGGALGLLVKTALNFYLQPKLRLGPSGMHAAEQRQGLLTQKDELVSRQQALTRDGEAMGARLDRLVASEAKMLSIGEQVYQAKLERTRAAVTALQALVANQKLLSGLYDRAITMVELELDDFGLEQVAGEPAGAAFSAQLAELEAMDATTAELRIRVEAQAEVLALLSD